MPDENLNFKSEMISEVFRIPSLEMRHPTAAEGKNA
jgi:hypothetical protein